MKQESSNSSDVTSSLSEGNPEKQGLKLNICYFRSPHDLLSEGNPEKQGLKQVGPAEVGPAEVLSEGNPEKQGLKLAQNEQDEHFRGNFQKGIQKNKD